MDIPTPPPDRDTRNIIDEVARCVARNGHEFEVMTKAKQKDNPKFSFLYGGEHFKYYQCKVFAEQALINRQGSTPLIPQNTPHQPSIPSSASANLAQWIAGNIQQPATVNPTQHFPSATPMQQTPSPAPYNSATDTSLEQINQQLSVLRDQIQQSEQNLNAQHTVLLLNQQQNQQQNQIEKTVAQEQIDLVKSQAETCEIQLSDMDAILQPIIDTCSKDSILTGKRWIFQNATTSSHASVISKYLLLKVINKTSNFIQKLHVIYLVNDVLYHCVRKKAEDLKKCFEEVVVPMFCNASTSASDEQRPKLDKLVKLWESKANYFEAAVVNQLKNPIESYKEYQREQVLKYMSGYQTRFDNNRQQHLAFVNHAMQQIQTLEVQRKALEIQKTAQLCTSNANAKIQLPQLKEISPETDLISANKKITKITVELNVCLENLDELNLEKAEMETDLDTLSAKLLCKDKLVQSQETAINELKKNMQQLEATNDELQVLKAELETSISVVKCEMQTLDIENACLKNDLEELNIAKIQSDNKLQREQEQNIMLTEKCKKLTILYDEIKSEHNELSKQQAIHIEANDKIQELSNKIELLCAENQGGFKVNTHLELSNRKLKTKFDKARLQMSVRCDKIRELREQLDTMEAENLRITHQNASTSEKLKNSELCVLFEESVKECLMEDNEQLKIECTDLKRKLSTCYEEINNLKEQHNLLINS